MYQPQDKFYAYISPHCALNIMTHLEQPRNYEDIDDTNTNVVLNSELFGINNNVDLFNEINEIKHNINNNDNDDKIINSINNYHSLVLVKFTDIRNIIQYNDGKNDGKNKQRKNKKPTSRRKNLTTAKDDIINNIQEQAQEQAKAQAQEQAQEQAKEQEYEHDTNNNIYDDNFNKSYDLISTDLIPSYTKSDSISTNRYGSSYNIHRLPNILFAGSSLPPIIPDSLCNNNYIMKETITIPLVEFSYILSDITFDNIKNNTFTFEDSLATVSNIICNNIQNITDNNIDIQTVLLCKILNDIYKHYILPIKVPLLESQIINIVPPSTNTYLKSKNIIPFIDHILNNKNNITELWNMIMNDTGTDTDTDTNYKDPLAFLYNHNLIVKHKVKYIFSKIQLHCVLNSNVYFTEKKFNSLTYIDALPYSVFFLGDNDTIKNNSSNNIANTYTHNDIVKQIQNYVYSLNKLNSIIASANNNNDNNNSNNNDNNNNDNNNSNNNTHKTKISVKREKTLALKQSNELIFLKTEIARLKTLLTPINMEYRNHILTKTHVGIRTMFSDGINETIPLLYLRMFAIHNTYYNNKIKFIYCNRRTGSSNIIYDEFKLYIKKDIINDIILTNIKCDLFSLSRLIPIPQQQTQQIQNETIQLIPNTINNVKNVNDNSFNTTHTLSTDNADDNTNTRCRTSINKLLAFVDNNIALKLLTHQINNISWMLKLEYNINNNMVYVMCPHFKLINNDGIFIYKNEHIKLLQYDILNLYYNNNEAHNNNYIFTYNDIQYIINIDYSTELAKDHNIIPLLNVKNYYGNLRINNIPSDIINSIIPYNTYINNNTYKTEFCGGCIADEVGLGKTLSISAHMIINFNNDMKQYSYYINKMP